MTAMTNQRGAHAEWRCERSPALTAHSAGVDATVALSLALMISSDGLALRPQPSTKMCDGHEPRCRLTGATPLPAPGSDDRALEAAGDP
jgi:hypothetical protein